MKYWTYILATLLLLGGGTDAAAQAATTDSKIGFINSQQILESTPGARQAQEQWEREMADIRTEVERMGQELEQMIQQYQQQELTLSPEAKASRQEEIRQKQNEYQQRVQQLQNQADRRQQEIVAPVMERINTVIEQIRAEGGYTLIFDLAAGAIISADPSLDLTQQVIQRLQARAGEDGSEQ